MKKSIIKLLLSFSWLILFVISIYIIIFELPAEPLYSFLTIILIATLLSFYIAYIMHYWHSN